MVRAQGPRGLEAWLKAKGRAASAPSAELDALCRQKDAHTSLLYWFTELPAAIEEVRRTGKPILSLRLLGNLDEELSCANSRFFRKMLYPDPRVNAILRERFVLHWQSVRPVPIITIDFGGGKKLTQTITGNSVHLVLDAMGRPVDALPGLMRAEVFARQLLAAHELACAPRRQLAERHRQLLMTAAAQPMPLPYAAPPPGMPWQQPPGMPPGPPAFESRAFGASRIAMSKHLVEAPLLGAITRSPLDADTEQNLALHQRIHEEFAGGTTWAGLDGFVEWIYAELFAMPLGDPALGLDVPDPFSAIAPIAPIVRVPEEPSSEHRDASPHVPRVTPRPSPSPHMNPSAAPRAFPTSASVGQPTFAAPPPPARSPVRRFASTIARAFVPSAAR